MDESAAKAGRAKLRVLVVDDHPMMQRGIRDAIEAEPDLEVCATVADVAAALRSIRELHPDLVLVDLSLGNESGLDLIEKVGSTSQPPKMLVLSMHDESLYAARALRAGACGYVNKAAPGGALVEAIRTVLGGGLALSKSVSDQIVTAALHGTHEHRSELEALSNRELQVFRLLGQGLTVRETARSLHISHKTVETHIQRIKAKLGLEGARQVVRHATLWAEETGRSGER